MIIKLEFHEVSQKLPFQGNFSKSQLIEFSIGCDFLLLYFAQHPHNRSQGISQKDIRLSPTPCEVAVKDYLTGESGIMRVYKVCC